MADLHKHRDVALASATRTATNNSAKFYARRHCGIIVYLNVTAASGTGGLKVFVRAYDLSGNAYALNGGGAAKVAAGRYAYVLYPGGGSIAGDIADIQNAPCPGQFDVQVTHADASNYTYEVGYELIP